MENKKEITIGAFLSYVQIAVGAVITLLYTPFMIRILGQSEYGLYNTVSSVVSSLSILNLGFGSCYVRFFSKYNAEDNKSDVAKLNGMFMIIFVVIGFIAFICGLYLSFNLQVIFDQGLSKEELQTAKTLMILLTINLSISFPTSVFTSIITANEKFIFQKVVLLIKQIASPLICIPLLLAGYASVGIVLSTVILYLVLDFVNAYFCLFKLKTKFSFKSFDFKIFREMAFYSGFIAINMIVDQINLNIDKFLLGRFRGTTAVAVYSAGYTIYSYYTSFSTSISNVFTPKVHHIWSNVKLSISEKNSCLTDLFTLVGRIQFSILLLVSTGLIIFGKQFISIWAGSGYENAYYVLLLLALSSIVPLSQNVGIEIQRAQNKHQYRALLYLFMAIINLVLSIGLCQKYGEIGSAIGTAISFIIANTLCMNMYYYKALKINIIPYWKNCIKSVISIVPAVILGCCFCMFVNSYKFIWMLIGILLYAVLYLICLFLFSCNKDEKKSIMLFIEKSLSRIVKR